MTAPNIREEAQVGLFLLAIGVHIGKTHVFSCYVKRRGARLAPQTGARTHRPPQDMLPTDHTPLYGQQHPTRRTDWPKWPSEARRWPPYTWSTQPNARPQRAHRRPRVAARTPSHATARARIDRARDRRQIRRGARTRDPRRRHPPRTHARRRSLRLAFRVARDAVTAALGCRWQWR